MVHAVQTLQHAVALRECSTDASSMRRSCNGAYSTQWHSDSAPLVSAACDDAATVSAARSSSPTVLHWCRQRVTMLRRCLQHAVALGRCFTESVQAAAVLRACKGCTVQQYSHGCVVSMWRQYWRCCNDGVSHSPHVFKKGVIVKARSGPLQ